MFKNREHAIQALARTMMGHADMQRIFEARRCWAKQPTDEIVAKLAELRQRLDRLQQKVGTSSAASD